MNPRFYRILHQHLSYSAGLRHISTRQPIASLAHLEGPRVVASGGDNVYMYVSYPTKDLVCPSVEDLLGWCSSGILLFTCQALKTTASSFSENNALELAISVYLKNGRAQRAATATN